MDLLDLDADRALSNLVPLVVAFVIALPIGWDREQRDRSLGLRTFPLVAVASCAFALIAERAMPHSADGFSRVLQGIITGIGFLGGGAMLKQGKTVHGSATAAAVWTTAAIGVAVARGLLEIALLLGALGFVTLRYMLRLKKVAALPDEDARGASQGRADSPEES